MMKKPTFMKKKENGEKTQEQKNLLSNLSVLEKLKDNKRVKWMALVILVFLVILAVVLIMSLMTAFSWEKGGENTLAPFRYHEKSNGTVIVKIDMSNYPDGILEDSISEKAGVTVKDKGRDKKEQVYTVSAERNLSFIWTVDIYKDKKAKKAETPSSELSITFLSDEHGKFKSILCSEMDLPVPVQEDDSDYKFTYVVNEIGNLVVDIQDPINVEWKTEYDEKKIRVGNVQEEADSKRVIISPPENKKNDKTVNTEVCIYTTSDAADADDTHTREIRFDLTLKDGVITVTKVKKIKPVDTVESSQQDGKRKPEDEYPEEAIPEDVLQQLEGQWQE